MNKKIILLILFLVMFSLTSVNAGWFGYDLGECKNFSITPPEGSEDLGINERTDDYIFIFSDYGNVSHYISINEMTEEQFNNVDNAIKSNHMSTILDDEKIENIRIIKTQTEKYNTKTGYIDIIVNETNAYFAKDGYYYNLSIDHSKGCPFDEKEFGEDTKIIKNIYNSLKRK